MRPLARCFALGLALILTSCSAEKQPTSPRRESHSIHAPSLAAIRSEIAAVPSPWTDPTGDVTLANADIVGGTVVAGDEAIEFRVRFAAAPFPPTATHFIDWGLDLDQNPATGTVIGRVPGADAAIGVRSLPNVALTLEVQQGSLRLRLDASTRVAVDRATNTVTVCIPASLLQAGGPFHYIVESAFGGSFGANDEAPGVQNFGTPAGSFLNEVGSPAPCCLSAAEACDWVGALADVECPCNGPWRSHGAYVSCIAGAIRSELAKLEDCLSEQERAAVQACVLRPRVRSECGRTAQLPVGRQTSAKTD